MATGLRLEAVADKDAPPQVFDSRNGPTEVVVPMQQTGYQPAESAIAKVLGTSMVWFGETRSVPLQLRSELFSWGWTGPVTAVAHAGNGSRALHESLSA